MCLSSELNLEVVRRSLPGQKEFTAYKFVNLRGEGANARLVSPVYDYVWKPGKLVAKCGPASLEGFYVFVVPQGADLTAPRNQQLLKLRIKAEHVKAGGPDKFGGVEGMCLVVSEVEFPEEDYQAALQGRMTHAKAGGEERAKKAVAKTRRDTKKRTAKKESAVKSFKKGLKKVVKKKATKASKATSAVKKAAKKAAKKEAAVKDPLSTLTVQELKLRAKDYAVTGYSKMKKDELIKAIKKASKRKK